MCRQPARGLSGRPSLILAIPPKIAHPGARQSTLYTVYAVMRGSLSTYERLSERIAPAEPDFAGARPQQCASPRLTSDAHADAGPSRPRFLAGVGPQIGRAHV